MIPSRAARRLWQAGFIWGLMVLVVALSACAGQAARPVVRPDPDFPPDGLFIDPDIVKREMDRRADFLIVDVRPQPDYEKDHIVGAINIPFFEMEQRYAELPKDKWLVFY